MAEETVRSPRRNDDIEVKLPMGVTVRASGKQVTLIILVILGVCAILWLLREHGLRDREDHGMIADKLDAIVYVLTLPEKEREDMKMNMPTALRKQLRGQDRDR